MLLLPVKVLNVQTDRSCKFLLGKADLEVSYIHSVSRTEVVDIYTVNGSGIYAREQLWQQFDAGQPDSYDRIENGFFVKELRMHFTAVDYGFIPLNNATVKVDGNTVFANVTKLHFEVESLPLAAFVVNKLADKLMHEC